MLTRQTSALVSRGERTEDIVWLLSPTHCIAMPMRVLIEQTRAKDMDLTAQLEALHASCPTNHLSCVYLGPEGALMTAIAAA